MAVEFFAHPDLFLFNECLSHSTSYAEYGAGLSTVVAASVANLPVRSVESDPLWFSLVEQTVGAGRVSFVRPELGNVGDWGMPVSYKYSTNFPLYVRGVFEQEFEPNFVYIDGRFRVACWIETIINAKPGTLILVDDYRDQPKYQIMADYLMPTEVSGRQALWVRPDFVEEDLLSAELSRWLMVMD
jgi:hypothetical protein